MRITEEELDRELYYQTVMHFVKGMFLQDLISENEFFQIEARNRNHYNPLVGILLSGKFLLRTSGRVDAFIRMNDRRRLQNVVIYNSD